MSKGITMKKITLNVVMTGALLIFTGCAQDHAKSFGSAVLPELPPQIVAPVEPGIPATPMVFDVNWTSPDHPNQVSFTLSPSSKTNQYYKRIDLYSDVRCLELIDIVTPNDLEQNEIIWPAVPGVPNHISVIETDINGGRRACKVVASSSEVTDIIPPSPPENLKVSYKWLDSVSLEITASWSASLDKDNVNYTIKMLSDPNGYSETLATLSTTELSTRFVVDTSGLDLATTDRLFFHIVAADPSNNISLSTTGSGIYIGNSAAAVNTKIAYLYRGQSGLMINVSGTCQPGINVNFIFTQMDLFGQVLPTNVSCEFGIYSVSFPALYWWYQDGMRVKAFQVGTTGATTEYTKWFAYEAQLDAYLLY